MYNQVSPVNNNFQFSAANVSKASAEIGLDDVYTGEMTIKRNPYDEYNYVIIHYNCYCNRIDELYLNKVPTSVCVKSCNCLMFIFLCIGFLPFVSVPIFIFALYRFITLIRITKIVNKNRDLVPNPLERMILCPELKALVHYADITSRINYEQLNLVGLSTDYFEAAAVQYRNELIQGKPIRVMFYNDTFKKYESNVLKYMCPKMYFSVLLLLLSFFGCLLTIIVSITMF